MQAAEQGQVGTEARSMGELSIRGLWELGRGGGVLQTGPQACTGRQIGMCHRTSFNMHCSTLSYASSSVTDLNAGAPECGSS